MVSESHRSTATRRMLAAVFSWFVQSRADKGHLEVERKFALSADEANTLPERLQSAGYKPAGTVEMTDTFLPVPEKGDMMRVRQESLDGGPLKTLLTFKRWVPTSTGKERQETERQVAATVGFVWALIGRLVNGSPLLRFSKIRQLYEGDFNGEPCVVSIDRVDGLGQYSGWYLEVELIVPLDGDPSLSKQHIFELVDRLLGQPRDDVKRSYQEMLRLSQ